MVPTWMVRVSALALTVTAGQAQGLAAPDNLALPNRIAQVSLGLDHTCARLVSGQVFCWGGNDHGQLGSGDRSPLSRPAAVAGVDDAVDVVASDERTCAVRRNGTVACWGASLGVVTVAAGEAEPKAAPPAGQLRADILGPREVRGLTDVAQLAMGRNHACARKKDATVWCWGSDGGAEIAASAPAQVLDLGPARAVVAGDGWTCALGADGTWCWGSRVVGSLASDAKPQRIDAAPELAVPVWGHSICRVAASADLYCRTVRPDLARALRSPALPSHMPDVRSFSAGQRHACVVTRDGMTRCWGANSQGQLGDGTTSSRSFPLPVRGMTDSWTVTAGLDRSCTVDAGGRLWCWGEAGTGQAADSTWLFRSDPQTVAGWGSANYLAAGGDATCAVDGSAHLFCWGATSFGGVRSRPALVPAVSDVDAVSVADVTCVRQVSGTVRCAGNRVLDSQGLDFKAILSSSGPAQDIVDVGASALGVCVRDAAARTACWLAPGLGQASSALRVAVDTSAWTTTALVRGLPCGMEGSGLVTCAPSMRLTLPALEQVTALAANSLGGCAVTQDRRARCWGAMWRATPYADEGGGPRSAAVEVPQLSGVQEVAVGERHACARTSAGQVWCWGGNRVGQVGNSAVADVQNPQRVQGVESAVQLALGRRHSCARVQDGGVMCWGDDTVGQLGLGRQLIRPLAAQVTVH